MPTSTLQSIQTKVASSATEIGQNFLTTYFSHLGLLEFVSVIISILCFVGIAYVAVKTGWLESRVDRVRDVVLKTDMPKYRAQISWKNIQKHFFEGDENDLKISIIEADKMLNEALRGAGVLGTQLGDRLKKIKPGQIPNIDDVWQAHKIRNQIAHEPDFVLKRDLAERSLAIYETALQNLGVFDDEVIPPPSKPTGTNHSH
jgi:hypothetical protein